MNLANIAIDGFSLAQIVCEIRYKQGYRYLDVCGDTLVTIENNENIPGWAVLEAGVVLGRLEHKEKSMMFGFGPDRAHLTQVGEPLDSAEAYLTHAGILFKTVYEAVRPSQYPRHGIRFWDFRGVSSVEDGIELIDKHSVLKANRPGWDLLERPRMTGRDACLRAEDDSTGLRLSVSVVRRADEGKSKTFTDEFSPEETNPPKATPAYKQNKDQRRRRVEELKRLRDLKENPRVVVLVDLDYHEKQLDVSDPVGFIKRGLDERARILPRLFQE